jgi:predicted ATPase
MTLHPRVTYLVGENGSGKSTILEAIAVAAGFNAEGGSSNFHFSTRRSESRLCDALRLVRSSRRPRTGFFLRAESYFNLATNIEDLDREPGPGPPVIDSYGGKSLHEQSHGESFLALLTKRFGGDGLYVVDEPEAALSPMRQMSALARIHQLVLEGSQFVVATHAPILLAYPGALIYELNGEGIREVPYEETATYAVTRDFILHRETMLRELLANEP